MSRVSSLSNTSIGGSWVVSLSSIWLSCVSIYIGRVFFMLFSSVKAQLEILLLSAMLVNNLQGNIIS